MKFPVCAFYLRKNVSLRYSFARGLAEVSFLLNITEFFEIGSGVLWHRVL